MDANVVALAKTVKDKALAAAREGLAIGVHPIDCLVRITGTIKVGADTTTDVREGSVVYKDAFATVCGMLVEQCRRRGEPLSTELLEDLIYMAMRQDETASGVADEMMEMIESAERDCTKVTGTKPKKGTVTTKLVYEFAEVKMAPGFILERVA